MSRRSSWKLIDGALLVLVSQILGLPSSGGSSMLSHICRRSPQGVQRHYMGVYSILPSIPLLTLA